MIRHVLRDVVLAAGGFQLASWSVRLYLYSVKRWIRRRVPYFGGAERAWRENERRGGGS